MNTHGLKCFLLACPGAAPFSNAREGAYTEGRSDGTEGWLTWRGVRGLPGVGHVEHGLLDQRWGIHAPADEEAGSAAEEDPNHQEKPAESTAVRLPARGPGGPRTTPTRRRTEGPEGGAEPAAPRAASPRTFFVWRTPGRHLACGPLGCHWMAATHTELSELSVSNIIAPKGREAFLSCPRLYLGSIF